MSHILIVDDEPDVLQTIRDILEKAGFRVTAASSGEEALRLIRHDRFDLVVLDMIMPEMNGLELCERLRADPFSYRMPILFLTAKGRARDIAQGLDGGGDDYLTKPFDVIELPARIRALLRRGPGGALDPESDSVRLGNIRVPMTRPEAIICGETLTLRPAEHRLLVYLMLHAGQPVSAERLLEEVWAYPPGVGDPTLVYVHIANLRARIEMPSGRPQLIRNIRGRGYMIDAPARRAEQVEGIG